MIRLVYWFSILFWGFITVAASPVENVRNSFPYFTDEKQVDRYIEALKTDPSALAQAYVGALYFFKAKFASLPTSQYVYFKKGKKHIENAVQLDPNHLEIRSIRLIFQYQLPLFLGYYQNRNQDLDFFIQQYQTSSQTHSIKEKFCRLLLQIETLEPQYKKRLNQLI